MVPSWFGDTVMTKDSTAAPAGNICISKKMEALSGVAGAFAHDFNNCLTAVTGNLELLERKLADRPELLVFVHEALAGAAESAALTRQMLAFSGRQMLYSLPLDANDKLAAMEEDLRLLLGNRIRLQFELEENPWRFMADPDQLEIVIRNLVLNSREAIEGDGEVVIGTKNTEFRDTYHSSFAAIGPGRYVKIFVRDSGSGIEESILPKIIDPFFSTKKAVEHSGLGFSTAYGFARRSGGGLDMEFQPATCASLYFPAL
jgi:signal transduction histidine kinase